MKMTSNKIRKWVGNFKFMYTSLLKCLTESWKMGRQLQFYVYFTIKMTNKGDQKWVTASRLCKFCYRDGKQDCSGIGGQLQLYAPFYYQDGKQSS